MAQRTMVMNIDLEGDEEINLLKDAKARLNACYKFGEWDIFKEIVSKSPLDSYDPVVGKWMTNLVATTPITAKAMKNLYAELNRQKDLK